MMPRIQLNVERSGQVNFHKYFIIYPLYQQYKGCPQTLFRSLFSLLRFMSPHAPQGVIASAATVERRVVPLKALFS